MKKTVKIIQKWIVKMGAKITDLRQHAILFNFLSLGIRVPIFNHTTNLGIIMRPDVTSLVLVSKALIMRANMDKRVDKGHLMHATVQYVKPQDVFLNVLDVFLEDLLVFLLLRLLRRGIDRIIPFHDVTYFNLFKKWPISET
jgi:hypothetical protein